MQELRCLVFAVAEIVDEMFGSAQSKCQNADRCGFVGAVQEHAGIAHVQVRHVMGLSKSIRHKFLRIVSHAASARFMQAPARNLWIFACPFQHSTGRTQHLAAHSHWKWMRATGMPYGSFTSGSRST